MVDDSVHHGEIGEEGNDFHPALAFGTDEWVDFINLADHLGPAPAGNPRTSLLNDPELVAFWLFPPSLPPMSIGVEAEVANRQLPLVRDMRGDPGDELQVVHLLHQRLRDELLPEKKSEDLLGENLGQEAVGKIGDMPCPPRSPDSGGEGEN